MKKQVKYEAVHLQDDRPIPVSSIKIDLQPDDIITAGYDEGYQSENEAWDPHFFLIIERTRPETDEEYKDRTDRETFMKEDGHKRRYQHYLKLKEEFES